MTQDVRDQIIGFLPRLRRFAFALTGSADRADDLVQDTCVRALTHIDQWQPGTRLDSWMYRIAQNLWHDRNRALAVRGVAADLDTANEIAGSDGRDVTEGRLSLAAVNAGIQKLPANQRELVALVCVEGLSYKEAAETLGIPIGTVMSRLARAREALYVSLNGAPVSAQAAVAESRNG